ncbi:hypothetical protein KFK09_016217 [Dendrobium nobile]|uniref:Membrin n=1 Tax=Dendrobium nobile TaxID=94219 RepID=A0A8T3AXN5_DENNO|nr:hypothetical protein KFK09_016217 [Dendrobium nobile]
MEAAAGGGTLSELYQNARRLLLRTRDALEKLERLDSSSFSSSSSSYSSSLPSSVSPAGVGLDPADLSFSIKRDVTQIQSLCAEMDRLSRSIGAKGQRDLWKRKVEQVAAEADSLRESLDKHALRQQKKVQEAKERADLLGRARAQRKALDVLNTVGLSNSVLKLIERRHHVDKWIAYAGMVITVVVMYMFWRWTH